MPTRRDLLLTGAAAGAVAALGRPLAAAEADGFAVIEARPATVQLAPDGYAPTGIWGFDGRAPGPVLRAAQGGRLQRRFRNALPQASSIHWHGIRSANAMDGVPGLTQAAVGPGGTFDYDLLLPDAGTYWYHSHNRSVEQVARGLHGALIVDEPAADRPDVDRDEVMVLDDWLLDPESAQLDTDFAAAHDRSHGGRIGNLTTTNGLFDRSMPVRRHERLRLRLINAANARIFSLGLVGFEGWTVALDGMPLATPEPVADAVLLGPGQRADLIVDVVAGEGESAYLARMEADRAAPQVTFPVRGAAGLARRGPPAALPANPEDAIELGADALSLSLEMEGGAMGRLRQAAWNGQVRDAAALARENQFWAFNGTVGLTDTPLARIDRGRSARVEIVNNTAFPHAMHLHGMHFREVLADGGLGPLRDTALIFGEERREIAFVAANPGDWAFHCHMLSHADAGMMTWIRVT